MYIHIHIHIHIHILAVISTVFTDLPTRLHLCKNPMPPTTGHLQSPPRSSAGSISESDIENSSLDCWGRWGCANCGLQGQLWDDGPS